MSGARPESVGARRARARDLGIPFDGEPGPLNAITDVAGVAVGSTTLIAGAGRLEVGKGPVRTGVSAILPRGQSDEPVFGGWYALNGNGEMTGTTWVEEAGLVEGPIMITNTHSVGVVRDAVIEWMYRNRLPDPAAGLDWALPAVAETYDGFLSDINGPRQKGARVRRARRRDLGRGGRRQRGRRHRHDAAPVQGRHRDGIAPVGRG